MPTEKVISLNNLNRYDKNLKTVAGILQRSTAYVLGDVVHKKNIYLKCTTAGTTKATTLDLTNVAKDATVTDGTVVWTVVGLNGFVEQDSTSIVGWATGTSYKVGDYITKNNQIYRCNTAHTADTFSNDLSKWSLIAGLQVWTANTSYKANSLVYNSGSLYRVKADFTSGSTFSDTNLEALGGGSSSGAGLEDWQSNHDYAQGDIFVLNNQIYKVLVAHTSGSTPDEVTKVDDTPISVWTAETEYTEGDVIEYQGTDGYKYYSVTANFTSGAEFEVTAEMSEIVFTDKYVPHPLTKAQIAELIHSFNPTSGGGETQIGSDVPIGTIISFMGITAPKDYLACDGTEYNIEDYKDLAEFIKAQFGAYNFFGGDGLATFCVPDLQGEFLRMTGTNSHTNQGSGSNVGVHQDATEAPLVRLNGGKIQIDVEDGTTSTSVKDEDVSFKTDTRRYIIAQTYDEGVDSYYKVISSYSSRPTNTSVLYCIKAQKPIEQDERYTSNDIPIGYIIWQMAVLEDYLKLDGSTLQNASIDYPDLLVFAVDNNLITSDTTNKALFKYNETTDVLTLPDYISLVLQGGNSVEEKEAGLPNIKGETFQQYSSSQSAGWHNNTGKDIGTGALYIKGGGTNYGQQAGWQSFNSHAMAFDASRSNPIYSDNVNTVQPPAITLIPQIRYKKTVVQDIGMYVPRDNMTVLYDGDIDTGYNVSSDFTLNLSESVNNFDKIGLYVYKDIENNGLRPYYREIMVDDYKKLISDNDSNVNFSVNYGYGDSTDYLSIKPNQHTTLTSMYVTANSTKHIKIYGIKFTKTSKVDTEKIAEMAMQSTVYETIPWSTDGLVASENYIAPADGYIFCRLYYNQGEYARLTISNADVSEYYAGITQYAFTHDWATWIWSPIRKGQKASLYHPSGSTVPESVYYRFYYNVGSAKKLGLL